MASCCTWLRLGVGCMLIARDTSWRPLNTVFAVPYALSCDTHAPSMTPVAPTMNPYSGLGRACGAEIRDRAVESVRLGSPGGRPESNGHDELCQRIYNPPLQPPERRSRSDRGWSVADCIRCVARRGLCSYTVVTPSMLTVRSKIEAAIYRPKRILYQKLLCAEILLNEQCYLTGKLTYHSKPRSAPNRKLAETNQCPKSKTGRNQSVPEIENWPKPISARNRKRTRSRKPTETKKAAKLNRAPK